MTAGIAGTQVEASPEVIAQIRPARNLRVRPQFETQGTKLRNPNIGGETQAANTRVGVACSIGFLSGCKVNTISWIDGAAIIHIPASSSELFLERDGAHWHDVLLVEDGLDGTDAKKRGDHGIQRGTLNALHGACICSTGYYKGP